MMGRNPGTFSLSDHKRLTSRESGFTLVELMVAITLSLFLIGAVTLTYLSARATSLEAEQLSRMQENLRFATDFLVRDIRNAGFRDHLTLTVAHYTQIAEEYAAIIDGDGEQSLTIRYAGRGACGQVFSTDEELKIVENRYYVDSGQLFCEGGTIAEGDTVPFMELPIVLAEGVSAISFEFLFHPAADATATSELTCNFLLPDADSGDFADACMGVRMGLTFNGNPTRSAQITAAFRNVIFDQVYARKSI